MDLREYMKTAKRLVITSLVMALAGCATTDSASPTQRPEPNGTSITGRFHRDTVMTWQRYGLESVDGKKVEFGFLSDAYTTPVDVEAGRRKLVVTALFNKDSKQYSATVAMDVDLKPSVKYTINAAVSGKYIDAWLDIAATGERATEKFTAVCKFSEHFGYVIRTGPCP
jgi:hypothetical protein